MRISDAELDLFKDWQPGDSITMDANSVGLLIQEIIQSRAAIRAWSDLDDERSNCEECEGMQAPETCSMCAPKAGAVLLKMRAIIEKIGEVTEDQIKAMADAPKNPTLKFDHVSIDLTQEEIDKLANLRSERVEAGRYEWTPGKALKDCRKDTA